MFASAYEFSEYEDAELLAFVLAYIRRKAQEKEKVKTHGA